MKSLIRILNPARASITTLLALILIFNSSLASAATLTSTVNRNSMSTSETLKLTVIIDRQVDSSKLDLSALRNDFEILGVAPRNSTSISTVNGKTSRVATTQWTITLAAKREGKLLIPALTVNQSSSKAITIEALSEDKISSNSNIQSAPLLVKGVANKSSIFPGQQLIYQIELSAAANVSDLNGSALEIPGAKVELLSQQQGQRIDNGVARNVVILQYAVFAEQRGQLLIPPITFTGLVGGRRSVFGNQGQKVVGRTDALSIEVKAKPSDTKAPWLPAEGLTINSSWSMEPNSIKTGTPVTRTITITAQAQLASAIPPLKQIALSKASIKSYKDKPTLDSKKTNAGFVATRIESEAIVINRAGEIELPAINVDWFNVNTEKWEQTTLPAETITVSGQAVTQASPVLTPTISNSSTTIEPGPKTFSTHWAWPLVTGSLALICLIQSYFLFRRKSRANTEPTQSSSKLPEAAEWKLVLQSFKGDNLNSIRNSIIKWARSAHPKAEFISLNALFKDLDSSLSDSADHLEIALYSANKEAYSSIEKANLKQELTEYRKRLMADSSLGKSHQSNTELRPLYSSV
jgi:hypothetical protein